jgi:hypothetical protein
MTSTSVISLTMANGIRDGLPEQGTARARLGVESGNDLPRSSVGVDYAVMPPSTAMIWPVMYEAPGPAR